MTDLGVLLRKIGRHMPRTRHQEGWVEEVGKKVRKWKGHYFVYVRQADGAEKRSHRAVVLGLKADLRKWEAEQKLRDVIAKETSGASAQPSPEFTLRWFWEQRFRPMKEPTWKESSRHRTLSFIEHYVMDPLGHTPLGSLNRFALQTHLNDLAGHYSHSVVSKFRVYISAILDEALEQDFIVKNPARKLEMPQTRRPVKRYLSEQEIRAIMGQLSVRDRLIVRMFLVLGLRPGELFALRRDDKMDRQLRIDESVSPDRLIVTPKTDASASYVWLPESLEVELDFWMEGQPDKRPEAFLFPSRRGTPLNVSNYLNQVLHPAAERARVELSANGAEVPPGFLIGITHQAFRRTCATEMQHFGTVKDVQAHLRHATPAMTVGTYMQSIPASVRAAVEKLDRILSVGHSAENGVVN